MKGNIVSKPQFYGVGAVAKLSTTKLAVETPIPIAGNYLNNGYDDYLIIGCLNVFL